MVPLFTFTDAAPWTYNAAAKYTRYVNSSTSFYDFELVNTYEDCRIWLFEGTITTPNPVATHDVPITFTDADAPLRGHIHRTTKPDEMRVVWNSRHNDDTPSVKWGIAPGVYIGSAQAEAATYDASDLCGDPAQT